MELQVFSEVATNTVGSIHILTATVSPTAAAPTVIQFEVESGPAIETDDNPSEDSGTTITVDDGDL
jgi:hypothetical protein